MKVEPVIKDGKINGVSIEIMADVVENEDGTFSIKEVSYDDGKTWHEGWSMEASLPNYVGGVGNENLLLKKYDTKELVDFYKR